MFFMVDSYFAWSITTITSRPSSSLHLNSRIDRHKSNNHMQSTSFIQLICDFKISSSSCKVSRYNNLFTIYTIINFLWTCEQVLKSLCWNLVYMQSFIYSISLSYTFTKNEDRSLTNQHLMYSCANVICPLCLILKHSSRLYF